MEILKVKTFYSVFVLNRIQMCLLPIHCRFAKYEMCHSINLCLHQWLCEHRSLNDISAFDGYEISRWKGHLSTCRQTKNLKLLQSKGTWNKVKSAAESSKSFQNSSSEYIRQIWSSQLCFVHFNTPIHSALIRLNEAHL